MSLPWFRLYHRMVDDEKLRLLAFEDRWHFVALCCLKADGLLDEPESDLRTRRIAVKLGVQVRELDEIARRLREVELVDELLSPIAWDELQQKSDHDSTAAERQRRKRQKDKALKAVTDESRVTVTEVTRLDTDKEEDKDIEPKGSCASGDAPLTVDEFVEGWNSNAASLGLAQIRKLTPVRRRKVQAQIKRFALDEWQSVFAKISQSPFLLGQNGGWRCDFDFILSENNVLKILEGKYDRQTGSRH